MYTQQDWGEYFERIKKIPKKNSAEHWIDGAKRREHTSPSLAPAVECNRILKKCVFGVSTHEENFNMNTCLKNK